MSDLPDKMSGVWLTGHGGKDKLVFKNDIPLPSYGETDVLIQVAAAAVNNTDINTRTAWYSKNRSSNEDVSGEDASWAGKPLSFPRIQGADVCGHIVAAGSKIRRDRIGQRVLVEPCLTEANGQMLNRPWYLGSEYDGGFAQFVAVASRHAHAISSSFSDVELASFPLKK